MTLIIRQVTKVNSPGLIRVFTLWLISLLFGAILFSCNTYIKPEEKGKLSGPNDTLFLNEVYQLSSYGNRIAQIAKVKSPLQEVRIFAEKVSFFQQNISSRWDSLSQLKQIPIVRELSLFQNSRLQRLDKVNTSNFDKEFFEIMEHQLVNHVNLMENVSGRSEDNDISTMAVMMLSPIQNQLDTLNYLREKVKTTISGQQ